MFVYTHTAISGHSWGLLLGWAKLYDQATGLCVQKLLSVLTFTELVRVSHCHCANRPKQVTDGRSPHSSWEGSRHNTKMFADFVFTQCGNILFYLIYFFICVEFILCFLYLLSSFLLCKYFNKCVMYWLFMTAFYQQADTQCDSYVVHRYIICIEDSSLTKAPKKFVTLWWNLIFFTYCTFIFTIVH